MGKKIKTVLLLLVVYLLVFWVGFKSGSIYVRMQKKMQVERVEIAVTPSTPLPQTFYVVERLDYGNYSRETIEEAYSYSPIIKIFMNEKLRLLLKSRDIKIYAETGERIYPATPESSP